ncbi:DUF2975 domain-containing protein [bacterium]|nr:DUF2975 domain-containing protein [bacterium]
MSEERPVHVSKLLSFCVRANWVLSIVFMIVIPLLFVFCQIKLKGFFLPGGESFQLQFKDVLPKIVDCAKGDVFIESYGNVTMIGNIPAVVYPQWVVFFLEALIGYFLAVRLKRLLQRVREGRPFDPANPKDIRDIGWLVISGTVLQSVLSTYAALYLRKHVPVPVDCTLTVMPQIDLLFIFLGLVILLLASIFQAGVDLQQEHDLTV